MCRCGAKEREKRRKCQQRERQGSEIGSKRKAVGQLNERATNQFHIPRAATRVSKRLAGRTCKQEETDTQCYSLAVEAEAKACQFHAKYPELVTFMQISRRQSSSCLGKLGESGGGGGVTCNKIQNNRKNHLAIRHNKLPECRYFNVLICFYTKYYIDFFFLFLLFITPCMKSIHWEPSVLKSQCMTR